MYVFKEMQLETAQAGYVKAAFNILVLEFRHGLLLFTFHSNLLA